jgi:hypothetical protein
LEGATFCEELCRHESKEAQIDANTLMILAFSENTHWPTNSLLKPMAG